MSIYTREVERFVSEPLLSEDADPKYVEFRFSGIVREKDSAEQIALDFMGFYLNGPYGGGGIQTSVLRYDPLLPQMIDRKDVHSAVHYLEVSI